MKTVRCLRNSATHNRDLGAIWVRGSHDGAMTQTISIENQRVLLELHALLRDIDPSRWRDDIDAAFRDRLQRIQSGAAQMMTALRADGKMDAIRERLDELSRALREYSPKQSLPSADALREEWMTFRKRVAPLYESCAHLLARQAIRVPSLRPTNYARSALHVGSGLFAIVLLELLLPMWALPWASGGFALVCWSLEITRRIWPGWNKTLFKFPFFKIIAHPREVHHVNSATWLATAVTILALLQSQIVALAALAVVSLADPSAATIGRRWGRTVLMHGRTLEGSLAFIAVGTLSAFGALVLFHSDVLAWHFSLIIAAAAAFFGCIAELVSKRLDDNLTVPLTAVAGASIAMYALGLWA